MQLRQLASVFCVLLLPANCVFSHCFAEEVATKAGENAQVPKSVGLLVSELFDEEILADNVFAVRRHEFELTENDQYESLSNWVLPSDTHSTIRMSGAFTPTDPAPIVSQEYLGGTNTGGTLVSPVFDLLDLAAKLGRLKELKKRVVNIPEPATESQQRALVAVRILLALELSEDGMVRLPRRAKVRFLPRLRSRFRVRQRRFPGGGTQSLRNELRHGGWHHRRRRQGAYGQRKFRDGDG